MADTGRPGPDQESKFFQVRQLFGRINSEPDPVPGRDSGPPQRGPNCLSRSQSTGQQQIKDAIFNGADLKNFQGVRTYGPNRQLSLHLKLGWGQKNQPPQNGCAGLGDGL